MKVVCPTRGLVFAETLLSLKRNGVSLDDVIIESGTPIPDCLNIPVKKALEGSPSHILTIEDDMQMPDDSLEQMVKMDKAIVAIDYPVDNGYSVIGKKEGVIQHAGFGCTLINASIFRKMPYPWFETDKSINYDTGEVMDNPMKYGGHDIWFFRKCRELGYEIHQLPGFEAKHLRCNQLNRIESNNGTYKIEPLPKVKFREE